LSKSGKRFLFVVGVPRSGTTAAARILNHHSRILLGIERYKNLCGRKTVSTDFGQHLFERDRFHNVQPEDTNIPQHWGPDPDAIFARALWIGDKVPNLYMNLDIVADRFQGSLMFCLIRDPHQVAASWQARAASGKGDWPASNDYMRAIAAWNKANRRLLEFKRLLPDQLHFLSYEGFLSLPGKPLDTLLAKLDLEPEKGIVRFRERMLQTQARIALRKEHFSEMRERAEPLVETGPYENLKAMSLI